MTSGNVTTFFFLKYFRATIRGKLFQLRFLEEVNPDDGKAERSGTTGHLVIRLARVHYQKKSKPHLLCCILISYSRAVPVVKWLARWTFNPAVRV